MIVVADQNIPCVGDAFADLGDVRLLPGREITREDLKDCRCLITRTVTRVDASLLHDTPVEFVGTATIGTDHVDLDWLADQGIGFSNAAGCNAESAAEYVVTGLFALSRSLGFDPFGKRVGIVGCGNVGSRLLHKLETLGIECQVCDPPLAARGALERESRELDALLAECDVISLHVPLTHDGPHATHHLLDARRLEQLRADTLLINAARGEVIDNRALLDRVRRRPDLALFLDTWEGEPLLLRDLLARTDLATPHIAGYSTEGRLRGTQMVLDAASRHFDRAPSWHMNDHLPPRQTLQMESVTDPLTFWQELFQAHCDIWRDHRDLTAGADLDDLAFARHFDSLRRVFADRLEYSRFRVVGELSAERRQTLQQLGFEVAA